MTVGTPPGTGPGLVDGAWLAGLAGGGNLTAQSGLAAPNANSQATATVIPPGIYLVEVDSSVATGSVVLPPAVAGTELALINNGTGVLNVFADPTINQLTGALDTINNVANGTAVATVTAPSTTWYSCAKNGKWFSK